MEKVDLLFWTDILSEHAAFQVNAFSPKEEKYVAEANRFHHIFKKWNQAISSGQSIDIRAIENDTANFIVFKKAIIYELLCNNVLINFSPSFVNHMVNEADEFIGMLRTGACPEKAKKPSLYIKTWLADAYGHAFTLSAFLDLAETPSIQRAEFFMMMFEKLGKKASELEMIRENLKTTMQVSLLEEETVDVLEDFIEYNTKLGELLDDKKIMSVGTLSSVLTNHFIKEHKYFINKLKTCVS